MLAMGPKPPAPRLQSVPAAAISASQAILWSVPVHIGDPHQDLRRSCTRTGQKKKKNEEEEEEEEDYCTLVGGREEYSTQLPLSEESHSLWP